MIKNRNTTNMQIGLEGASADVSTPAKGEFRHGWSLVFASAIGVGTGLLALPFYTYGLLAPSLEQEFDWPRAISQMPLLFQTIGLLIMLPYVGWAVDRYGPRIVALCSLAAYSLVWLLFANMSGSVFEFGAIAFLLGITGAGTAPVSWTRAINGAFVHNRGIALGLTLMGTGVTALLAPSYVEWLLASFGWRGAYVGLAMLPGILGLSVCWLLFKVDERPTVDLQMSNYGVTLSESLSDFRLWLIAFAIIIVSFVIGGLIPNLFPLLLGSGYETGTAASVMSVIGISVIVGRLVTGYLLDRLWAPAVSAFLIALPAAGCLLLLGQTVPIWQAVLAASLIGLAAGAEVDIIAYLAVKYFGLRHYSKIYSFLFATFAIGAAGGPITFGWAYDMAASYHTIILICVPVFLISGAAFLFLGDYPEFNERVDG